MSKFSLGLKIGLLVLLIVILGGSFYFGSQNFWSTSKQEEGEVQGEIVENGQDPDYTISESEEEAFFEAISYGVPLEKIPSIRSNLIRLKEKDPAGYFVVIKLGAIVPDTFKRFYEDGSPANLVLLVRELMIAGQKDEVLERVVGAANLNQKEGYLFEDVALALPELEINYNAKKLLAYFENPQDFDRYYLTTNQDLLKQDLRDITAYLTGINTALLFKGEIKKQSLWELRNLLQRLDYLESYLQLLKQKQPREWQKLATNKEVVFLIRHLFRSAIEVIPKAKKSKLFLDYQFGERKVLAVQNRGIIDQLVQVAKIKPLEGLNWRDSGLREDGIEIEAWKY